MNDVDMPGWKRNVGLFLAGQTISLFGSMVVMYAVMWHLTIETRSGSVLMLSIVFGMLPQAFVSIFGGVWADRHHRKFLIMGSDTVIAVATLGLALLMLSGVDSLWVIYAALAVRSVFAGIQTPAVSAMIPQIAPADQLMRVNGMFQSIQSGMMLLAPALAAVIYASFDIVTVFFVDVATALIGVGMLALVAVPRLVRSDAGEPVSYFGDLAAGVRYIGTNAPVRWLIILFALVMFLVGAPSYLTPLMVTRTFGDEVWKLTANELFWGGGMLLGGILMASVGPRITRRVRLMVGSVLATGVLVAGLGVSTNMWVFFSIGLVIGVMFAALNTPAMTIVQERVEPEMQGRVFGFVGIVMTVAMPLSMVVFGPLADRFSVEALLVLAGVLLVVVLAAILAFPGARRSLAQVDAAPEGAAPEPVVPQDTAGLR
ncbi:MFS transporter [Promicromonospora thailandica]|uniref:MFS transporter, DHA3 family, macrolide efflux protein n=1 Tax=Promicromonospora thailandica TaxID=765201 RepID=A0A9X2FZ62_9MICO|nr:MFS transporter [Promicromonospora thailandica]MCP2264070.1 MFS transporter, DHA3 family, macrolide efflux protein [Promicromonospora thailandica]BFF17591.1 MFS transporter [Promicromonospora thailandica]